MSEKDVLISIIESSRDGVTFSVKGHEVPNIIKNKDEVIRVMEKLIKSLREETFPFSPLEILIEQAKNLKVNSEPSPLTENSVRVRSNIVLENEATFTKGLSISNLLNGSIIVPQDLDVSKAYFRGELGYRDLLLSPAIDNAGYTINERKIIENIEINDIHDLISYIDKYHFTYSDYSTSDIDFNKSRYDNWFSLYSNYGIKNLLHHMDRELFKQHLSELQDIEGQVFELSKCKYIGVSVGVKSETAGLIYHEESDIIPDKKELLKIIERDYFDNNIAVVDYLNDTITLNLYSKEYVFQFNFDHLYKIYSKYKNVEMITYMINSMMNDKLYSTIDDNNVYTPQTILAMIQKQLDEESEFAEVFPVQRVYLTSGSGYSDFNIYLLPNGSIEMFGPHNQRSPMTLRYSMYFIMDQLFKENESIESISDIMQKYYDKHILK